MLALLSALVVAALPAASPATKGAGGEVALHWKDRSYGLGELPAEIGAAARIAAEFWSPWSEAHRYRMDLVDDQRVLLITPREDGQPAHEFALIEKVARLFDEVAPAIPEGRREALGLPPAPPVGHKPKVETDPGGPDDSDTPSVEGEAATEGWTWTWSSAEAPDTKTCVLLALRDEQDYRTTLELLAQRYPYLAGWVKGAKGLTGFALEDPLLGTWTLRAAGQQEWSPDAALVHHAAQLLLARRFGTLPYWLVRGFAWTVEHELIGGHWYFPYRSGFIFATEHSAWEKMLADHAEKRDSIEMRELAGFARGSWNQEYALRAWGAVRWMRLFAGEGLPATFEHLRVHRWDHGRIVHEDGSWEIVPDYEVPRDDQEAILAQHLGGDFLGEMLRFFQKKKSGYQPPKH